MVHYGDNYLQVLLKKNHILGVLNLAICVQKLYSVNRIRCSMVQLTKLMLADKNFAFLGKFTRIYQTL